MWAGKVRRFKASDALESEQRQFAADVRAGARQGRTAPEIATLHKMPVSAVERILMEVNDPRVSDPAHLFKTRQILPGRTAADVQLYWLGYLKAAGHIWGRGAQSTLVVTLGEKSLSHMKTFLVDLADPYARHEFCRSTTLGWQLYVRDRDLCQALLPWGVPSDLDGDDPGMLDDLPEEFAIPFLHGYLDGDWPKAQTGRLDDGRPVTLHGTASTLTAINNMVWRYWDVAPGRITSTSPRATLRFSAAAACRTIRSSARRHSTRTRDEHPADTPVVSAH